MSTKSKKLRSRASRAAKAPEREKKGQRVRDRLVSHILVPDTHIFARRLPADSYVEMGALEEGGGISIPDDSAVLERTLRLLAEAAWHPSIRDMLALVTDSDTAEWAFTATDAAGLDGFLEQRHFSALLIRVQVATNDEAYRQALAVVPGAVPGPPVDVVIAGMVGRRVAKRLRAAREPTPRAERWVRQAAHALRDRQLAPGAGKVGCWPSHRGCSRPITGCATSLWRSTPGRGHIGGAPRNADRSETHSRLPPPVQTALGRALVERHNCAAEPLLSSWSARRSARLRPRFGSTSEAGPGTHQRSNLCPLLAVLCPAPPKAGIITALLSLPPAVPLQEAGRVLRDRGHWGELPGWVGHRGLSCPRDCG